MPQIVAEKLNSKILHVQVMCEISKKLNTKRTTLIQRDATCKFYFVGKHSVIASNDFGKHILPR